MPTLTSVVHMVMMSGTVVFHEERRPCGLILLEVCGLRVCTH